MPVVPKLRIVRWRMSAKLTIGSLFSGIGGLELGLERAEMETKWQVEYDNYCQLILKKHWPDVKRYGDIYGVKGEELERVDVVCGGFPCQPFSHAGKRKGTADSRWLWPEFLRIVREVRPKWVIIENVPGLLSIDSGRVFSGILRDLAESGYDAEWRVVSAQMLGARHRRERVFVVASRMVHTGLLGQAVSEVKTTRFEQPSKSMAHTQGEQSKPGLEQREIGDEEQMQSRRRSGEGDILSILNSPEADRLLETLRIRNTSPGGIWHSDPADLPDTDTAGLQDTGAEQPTAGIAGSSGREGERCGATQSRVGDMVDGISEWLDHTPRVGTKIPDRVNRLKCLGNAVVPEVSEFIGWCIRDND